MGKGRIPMWVAPPFGGCWGLVSGDSALGQTGLGVAAAAVQLILIVTIRDSPQTAKATSGAKPRGQ